MKYLLDMVHFKSQSQKTDNSFGGFFSLAFSTVIGEFLPGCFLDTPGTSLAGISVVFFTAHGECFI